MTQQGIEHPLSLIIDALRAIVPIFALFRCSADDMTNGRLVAETPDLTAECIVAYGICPSDALSVFCAKDKYTSPTKDIHVRHGKYHLISHYEKGGTGVFPDEITLVDILKKQLAIFTHVLESHQAAQQSRQLDLITQALDAIPQSVFVLDREQRYIFQNLSDRQNFGDLRGKRM